jgi:DNA-binding beta-propeller fold protein YncE
MYVRRAMINAWASDGADRIVITLRGKTAYVVGEKSITPICTATNTPGKSIHLGRPGLPSTIAITP